MRVSRPVLLLILTTVGQSFAAPRSGSPGPTPSPKLTVAASSDATVEAFLVALKAGNMDGAYAKFGPSLVSALPKDKFTSVWTSLTAASGKLTAWEIIERSQEKGRDVRIALMKFEKAALLATISTDPPSQTIVGIFFKPAPKPSNVDRKPAPYVSEAAFRSVEVSVGKEPWVLGGTLTVPAGSGPFPAVVLVHGSGPHDRDSTVGANRVFKDIAEGLSSRGIAVLRYEKRTFRYGDRLSNTIGLDDEVVVDAVAAIERVRGRPEIDKKRIFVLGHSLGALLAPEIAVRAGKMAGAILLAPPGRAPWDIVLEQMRYLGTPADKLAEIEKQVALVRAGTLGSGTLLGAPQSYWKDWASRDGIRMARRLGKPILIMRGQRDYQVTDDDINTWRKGLGRMHGVSIEVLPADNHLFIQGTGKPSPTEYDTPGHVDGLAIEKIAAFVTKGRP